MLNSIQAFGFYQSHTLVHSHAIHLLNSKCCHNKIFLFISEEKWDCYSFSGTFDVRHHTSFTFRLSLRFGVKDSISILHRNMLLKFEICCCFRPLLVFLKRIITAENHGKMNLIDNWGRRECTEVSSQTALGFACFCSSPLTQVK